MSQYRYPVIRWPYALASGENVLSTSAGNVTLSTTAKLIASSYSGDNNTGGNPLDIIKNIEAQLNILHDNTFSEGTSIVTVSLDTSGRVTIDVNSANGIDFYFNSDPTTTLPVDVLGFPSTADQEAYQSNPITATWVARGQWHADLPVVFNSLPQKRSRTTQTKTRSERPVRLTHSAARWVKRLIEWDDIKAGRILAAAAADADYAAAAGLATGDTATYEALLEYLVGAYGPYGDNRVYLYSSNDTATATREGPYEVDLDESRPGLAWVELGSYVQNHSAEGYPVRLVLRGDA